ncbi:hypothetical protein [Syntrophomonas wolfei]|jgi:hypothetical protein|uniref:Uncharacterized protein n=1 Tax=Syntrophomonas wolfei TaxID=863 RepID=A0A354YUY6_9FIRM|nr:hypothetical protein [Syntrophomonas wolfei]HBK53150.1 hypothetical protein [Syntrophomonas wolfei]
MRIKRISLFIILLAFYTSIMINYPSECLKNLGYNRVLDFYGRWVSSSCNLDFLYNPGLRQTAIPLHTSRVAAVIPGGSNQGIKRQMEKLLAEKYQVIIECSAIDTWHSSKDGQEYLSRIAAQAYRVVVFDGGHHLPTLGMAPDIILVPELAGFAVHTYMLDGMRVETIRDLAEEAGCPAVIVRIPRLALVKNQRSLSIITRRIMAASHYSDRESSTGKIMLQSRMSKFNGIIFAYVNYEYAKKPELFCQCLNALGVGDARKLYLAFDYGCISPEEAGEFMKKVSKSSGLPAQIVNEAVKVSSVFWGGK